MLKIINSIQKNWQSYRHAIRGIAYLIKSENNFKIQLICSFILVVIGFICDFSILKWVIAIILIGLISMAEAFNTALEKLADKVEPRFDKKIGLVKDVSAGAVLLISIAALIVGLILICFPV
ncbi:MAG: diacylglycerol kinase family protein [Reichenbachiella sp.]|uniref:diacylglycerol kinase family protein n=1 Tax=Reichenbachiella sp. TaxID=2184521 RepID=UPI0032655512